MIFTMTSRALSSQYQSRPVLVRVVSRPDGGLDPPDANPLELTTASPDRR
jgi:hypothetical protein